MAAAAAPKPQTATYRQQQLLGCAHLRQSVVSRGAEPGTQWAGKPFFVLKTTPEVTVTKGLIRLALTDSQKC